MSFPNRTDAAFYAFKTRPAWAAKLERDRPEHIDSVVNSHAGIRWTPGELAAHNLAVIVSGWMRRKEPIRVRLLDVVEHPQCAISPAKRAAFAKKWAKRMIK